jgi:hypothetical protein
LPRPHKLLDILKAKYSGQHYDEAELNSILAQAVADCVRKQVECGVEIVTDGEYSKPGFFTYIRERFDEFESRPDQKLILFQQEVSAFPEYYAQYFKEAMMGGFARDPRPQRSASFDSPANQYRENRSARRFHTARVKTRNPFNGCFRQTADMPAVLAWAAECRLCCKSLKAPGDEFSASRGIKPGADRCSVTLITEVVCEFITGE